MIEDKDIAPADPLWTMTELIYQSFDSVLGIRGHIENTYLLTAVRCQWIVVHLERALADPRYLPIIYTEHVREELESRKDLVADYLTRYLTKG